MGGVIQVDSGGEKFIPYAKKKLRELHDFMTRSGLGSFAKRIDVSDGSTIYINTLSAGVGRFIDKVRIVVQQGGLGRLLFGIAYGATDPYRQPLVHRAKTTALAGTAINASVTTAVVSTRMQAELISDVIDTEWSKDLSTFVAVSEYINILGFTITQVAGTATLSGAPFGAPYPSATFTYTPFRTVVVSGADQAGYNGTFTFAVASAASLTFPVDAGTASPATGSIRATLGVGQAEIVRYATKKPVGSISVASGVATVSMVAHEFAAGPVLIEGAVPTSLNGIQTITVASADSFTFTTAEADQAATGTIIASGYVRKLVANVTRFTDETPPSLGTNSAMMYRRTGVGITTNGSDVFLRSINNTDLFVHAVWNKTAQTYDVTRIDPPPTITAFVSGFASTKWYDNATQGNNTGFRSEITTVEAEKTFGTYSRAPRFWVDPYRGKEVFAEFRLASIASYSVIATVTGPPDSHLIKVAGQYLQTMLRYSAVAGVWGWTTVSTRSAVAWWYDDVVGDGATVSTQVAPSAFYNDAPGYGELFTRIRMPYSTALYHDFTYVGFEPSGSGFVISWQILPTPAVSTQPITLTALFNGTNVEKVQWGAPPATTTVKRDGKTWASAVPNSTNVGNHVTTTPAIFIESIGTQNRVAIATHQLFSTNYTWRWHHSDTTVDMVLSSSATWISGYLSCSGDRAYVGTSIYKDGVLIWSAPATTLKTITDITQVAGVATVNAVGHGFADGASVLIYGASPRGYNRKATVAWIDADHFTYPVSSSLTSPADTPGHATLTTPNDVDIWSGGLLRVSYENNANFEVSRWPNSPAVAKLVQDSVTSAWGAKLVVEVPDEFTISAGALAGPPVTITNQPAFLLTEFVP